MECRAESATALANEQPLIVWLQKTLVIGFNPFWFKKGISITTCQEWASGGRWKDVKLKDRYPVVLVQCVGGWLVVDHAILWDKVFAQGLDHSPEMSSNSKPPPAARGVRSAVGGFGLMFHLVSRQAACLSSVCKSRAAVAPALHPRRVERCCHLLLLSHPSLRSIAVSSFENFLEKQLKLIINLFNKPIQIPGYFVLKLY